MATQSKSVCIVGGGIAGLTAAYELHRQQQSGAGINFTLIESSNRLGGIVETHREQGFIVECGPDGWVTEKPWARELAEELGLGDQLIGSNDAERVTYVLRNNQLLAMPEGMRMMVPTDLDSLSTTPLFPAEARAAYAAELANADALKRNAPQQDESVASFVQRHFGSEVLRLIGAPLLGGVFGGDTHQLSVRAVMMPFVKMEQEHGSLIAALQARAKLNAGKPQQSIFTSLLQGTGALAEALIATIPEQQIRKQHRVLAIARKANGWEVTSEQVSNPQRETTHYDEVILALPVHRASELLAPISSEAAALMQMPSSSATIVAFGFNEDQNVAWPKGFGFLAPEGEGSQLLAATFCDNKFANRVPPGGKLIRAYFGGNNADLLSGPIAVPTAKAELEKILGPLPLPALTVQRHWPQALPQYGVGHLDRMAQLQQRIDKLGQLHLLGNGYRGVGLPDLIRDARATARTITQR